MYHLDHLLELRKAQKKKEGGSGRCWNASPLFLQYLMGKIDSLYDNSVYDRSRRSLSLSHNGALLYHEITTVERKCNLSQNNIDILRATATDKMQK